MPRRTQFKNGEYYHIYNRGTDKREVFGDRHDYSYFIELIRAVNRVEPIISLFHHRRSQSGAGASKWLQQEPLRGSCSDSGLPPLVSIIAYSLLANHFHLLLRQELDNGISKFMHKLGMGYTQHFNARNKRSGSLFQGTYQLVPVISDDQLIYVSAYINGNAAIHGLAGAGNWPWSSLSEYLGKRSGTLPKTEVILAQFSNIAAYRDYIAEVTRSSKQRKEQLKEETSCLRLE